MGLFEQPSGRGIAFGLLGGLVGTVLMDVVIVITFLIAGEPGDEFFAMVGEKLGQGPFVGIVLHNIIGLSVGFIFVISVLNIGALAIDTKKKGLILGVSAGAITIPLGCIPFAVWLGEPILVVIAFSAVPHLVYGTVLGLVVTYGLLSWHASP
jgi:hypothetical protein